MESGVTTRIERGGSELSGYEIASAPVPPSLRAFVDSWVGYREWSPSPRERLEYPTGRAVLIFEFGAPIAIGRSPDQAHGFHGGFFAAIDDAPAFTAFTGTQAGVQIGLTPEGALALARMPMHELARATLDVFELGFRATLAEELAEARDWGARFRAVSRALEARFTSARPPSNIVRWALERIDGRHGDLRIDALSRELGFSRKHLHERFLAEIGLSPKRYADVRRFDHALTRLRSGRFESLGALAAELGYADQSHLARGLRRFAQTNAAALSRTLDDPVRVAIERLTA